MSLSPLSSSSVYNTNRDLTVSKDRSPVGDGAVIGPKPDQGGTAAPPITELAWSGITDTPTTLAGYGITDAATESDVEDVADDLASLIPALQPIAYSGESADVAFTSTAGLASTNVAAALDELKDAVDAAGGGGGGSGGVGSDLYLYHNYH
jgi:hypothetical protein